MYILASKMHRYHQFRRFSLKTRQQKHRKHREMHRKPLCTKGLTTRRSYEYKLVDCALQNVDPAQREYGKHKSLPKHTFVE